MADPDLPLPGVQAGEEASLPEPDAPVPEIQAQDAPALPLRARALGSNPIYKGNDKQ